MRLRSSKSHPIGKAYIVTDKPTLKVWQRPGVFLLTTFTAKYGTEWLLYVKTSSLKHDTEIGNFVMKSPNIEYIADAFDLPLHKP